MKLFSIFSTELLAGLKTLSTFAHAIENGTIAQLVEQRTENPCVPGSIPGGTTKKPDRLVRLFCLIYVIGYFTAFSAAS